jgi:ABC-2 type transport system permease protein
MLPRFSKVFPLILRHTYLYKRSPIRLIEVFFWPVTDLLVWGFLTMYLKEGAVDVPGAVTYLISAMILWDVLYRSQQGVTLSFLEDIWSRNLINVFASPIRVREFVAATYGVGLIKVIIVITVLTFMALGLYDFNLLGLGWSLIPLFANLLIHGWAAGLFTTALILRFGNAAQPLAWGIPFLIQPISAVFYPVSVLPDWIQPLAYCLPSTHVFEGMRAVMNSNGDVFPAESLIYSSCLNVVFTVLAALFFAHFYKVARERGLLTKIGTR